MSRFLLIFAILFVAACSGRFQKGAHQYLVPFLNSDGTYTWQEVELTTLNAPHKMEGSTASIHYKPAGAAGRDWGPVAEPRMAKSGNVWIPLDTPSALVLSTYATLEAIRKWEANIHPAAEKVYPRRVLLEVSARTSHGGEVTDNAFYDPQRDVVMVVPYTEGGIPLSVNQGIMAHEHFHVQFHHQMLSPMVELLIREESTDRELTTAEKINIQYNQKVLRAWNEGLADFYGYTFTAQPRFMDPSRLLEPSYILIRALDFDFESLDSKFMSESPRGISVNESRTTCTAGSPYCLGTQLGRLLYQMSGGNLSKAHSLVRNLYDSFPEWQTSVKNKFLKSRMDTNEMLTWTFSSGTQKLTVRQCDLLKKALNGDAKSLPACRDGGLP